MFEVTLHQMGSSIINITYVITVYVQQAYYLHCRLGTESNQFFTNQFFTNQFFTHQSGQFSSSDLYSTQSCHFPTLVSSTGSVLSACLSTVSLSPYDPGQKYYPCTSQQTAGRTFIDGRLLLFVILIVTQVIHHTCLGLLL